jgi:spermidine synthase
MLVLNMLLPFEADPIVTLGEVRWARECTDHDDVAPGLGVQFVDIDPNSLAKIRTFVSTISEPLVLAH